MTVRSPNTVISGSFLMRPSDGCGLSQTAVECVRNSPMEISVTFGETRRRRLRRVAGWAKGRAPSVATRTRGNRDLEVNL